ncbi:MAG: winged helix-turn-helix domain-containing protein [Candidatus Thorarchaeota archaeon]|nr:winged helix-turn-helix domain-containing protein [Candidatus Thorarchaeota archaeon]
MITKRLLWWLIAGTRGGANRARIILALHEFPSNANQLAERLSLDYKTIRHHLDVLTEHKILIPQGEGYGTMYFVSEDIGNSFDDFEQIWERIGKTRFKDANKK